MISILGNAPLVLDDSKNNGKQTEEHYNKFGFIDSKGKSDSNEKIWYSANAWNHDGNIENVGNGGQVVNILKWTTRANNKIDSAVAYVYGGIDSVFNYNTKLLLQAESLGKWYLSNGGKFITSKDDWPTNSDNIINFTTLEQISANVFNDEKWLELYPDSITLEQKKLIISTFKYWTETTPPENKWDNYINTTFSPEMIVESLAGTSSRFAGIDCRGLVQQSREPGESWDIIRAFNNADGNAYIAWNFATNPDTIRATDMGLDGYSYEIPKYTDGINQYNKYIVPGDIYVQTGHVTIFLNIEYINNQTREINKSTTNLIEASPEYIQNWRTLSSYPNSFPRRVK